MSEARMVELMQCALKARGIEGEVIAAGQFNPRGHTAACSSAVWPVAKSGDARRRGSGRGLDHGNACRRAPLRAPGQDAGRPFRHDRVRLRRALQTRPAHCSCLSGPACGPHGQVHKGLNVRVLELIDEATGSRVELKGNRLPATHSKDVIQALSS